jgi:hypothetical protein
MLRGLLIGILAFAWPQDTEETIRAIAIVKKANGNVVIDEKASGRPVVSLDL